MYPLILEPATKYAVWGGKRLNGIFGLDERVPAAKGLLLSADDDGESSVKNGELRGMAISEVVKTKQKKFFGAAYNTDAPFPAVVELVDANERLPLTVCDCDLRVFIIDAEKDSQMIYGFNRDITLDEIKSRISSNTLFSVCNFVSVKSGDSFTVPKGSLFALGKGIFAAAVFKSSKKSFVISDYGRVDKYGRSEKTDINGALSVLRLNQMNCPLDNANDIELYPFGTVISKPAEALKTSYIKLDGTVGIIEKKSFTHIAVLKGTVHLSYPSGSVKLKMGDSVLLPSDMSAKINGYAEILCTALAD